MILVGKGWQVRSGFWSAVVFVLLSIAFAAVAFLVAISNGHHRLIAVKLRIGALLLSVTGMGMGTGGCYTCYKAPTPGANDTNSHTDLHTDVDTDTARFSCYNAPEDTSETGYALLSRAAEFYEKIGNRPAVRATKLKGMQFAEDLGLVDEQVVLLDSLVEFLETTDDRIRFTLRKMKLL